jgi:hypothetical protein
MSKSKAHPETLREHHLRASHWEGVRGEYFTCYGNAAKARECTALSRMHMNEARQAAVDAMKPPPTG